MITLAIHLYDVVLFVHIFAVMLAFGVIFTYPVLDAAARRGHIRDLAALHRFQVVLSRGFVTPAMVVVLVAGVYLAQDRYSLGDGWISATLVILVVLFGLVGAVLSPTERRLAELAGRDLDTGGKPSAGYNAQALKLRRFGGLALALVAVAVFLMSTKPGA